MPGWLCSVFAALALCATVHSAELERPSSSGEPTKVMVTLILLDITRVDDANQTFTANLGSILQWEDPRLAHDGSGKISRNLDDVWNPRLQVVNVVSVNPTLPKVVEITPEGSVLYRQRVIGTFSQPLNLREFPFDTQEFQLQVVAVGYTASDVELVIDKERMLVLEENFLVPDWRPGQWTVSAQPFELMPGLEGRTVVILGVEMRRNSGYFLYKIILPLILIVAMSWIVFWIPPSQAGSQIGVGVTSMLTLIASRFMVGELVPRVSYLNRLDWFILGATMLVFATLVQAVITAHLAANNRLQLAERIDRVSRFAFPGIFAAVLVWSLFL